MNTAEPDPTAPDPGVHATDGSKPDIAEHHATLVMPWLPNQLARLAFAEFSRDDALATLVPRHLALLPPEALELDLDDSAQRHFGDYELLEKIGQGGMGVVYRARQCSLDREVALKLLAAGPWASNEFVERFKREAQSAARMQHPNIVAIYEIGSHDQFNFFSMRLVHGPSLAQRLVEHGAYAATEAAHLLRRIAEALDYAHRLGVLHLDLKPANVLMDERGEPQVADFGLARRLDESFATDSDEVSGTPSYMAPEQAQLKSHKLSPATDTYGLGAILYELLTGAPPFLGSTPQDTLERVVRDEVPALRSRRGEVPADLAAVCLKCLAKHPSDRYASARELADDLGRFLDGRPVSVRRLNAMQRLGRWAQREPRVAAALVAAILALGIGLAATSLQWRRAETSADTSRSLLWQGRRQAALRLEQDGKGFEALPQLLINLSEEEHAGKTTAIALDRRRIGLLIGQGATLIDRFTVADANPMATEISPDGSLLAISFNDLSVRWYDTATLTERGRVSLSDLTSSSGQRVPVLLLRFVDDHRLRATFEWQSNLTSPDDSDTLLIDLDHAKLIEPPAAFAHFADASYSADGRIALLRNRQRQPQLWQVPQSSSMQWHPLSTLAPAQADFLPWMIDPKGRFAIALGVALRHLDLHDLPGLSSPRSMTLPGNAGISAWALSGDGRTLAMGDFEGRVFLLDTSTHVLRALPTARGREITWVSFSEDDAWLGVGSFDGAVRAFDAVSGDSLAAGEMSHDFVVRRVGLSHDKRLLIAAGEGRIALWRLPLPGPRAVPAQRIGLAPAPHGSVGGYYPIGWSLKSGLLASAGLDGQVRLWRLPEAPLLAQLAARQVPERTFFDGLHVVDVEWNQLRITSTNGAVSTPWIKLSQPPGFAELLDGGRLLMVTVGPQLRVYDAATLKLRLPPIALVNSPQRLLANADGSRVLLSFGGSGPDGFQERLQLYNARTGMQLPGEAVLRGPLRHLAFSTDSARILAVGPAEGSTLVLSSTGLHRIGEYPHDPDAPVKWADFASAGDDVLLVTGATDVRLGNDTLLIWSPADDRVRSRQDISQTDPFGVIATTGSAFIAGNNKDLLLSLAGTSATTRNGRSLERLARSEPIALLALSPDHRLLARAFRREVQLYDADSGIAIGPPLQSDSGAMDVIAQLAYSPNGDKLLARTTYGHWLLWPIAAEQRPTAELGRSLARLNIDSENQKTLLMPDARERSELRKRDPGPWRAPDIRPVSALAASKASVIIPARAPGTSSQLLDLSASYDFAPDSIRNAFYNIVPAMRPLPAGVQRIAGVDFDMRGMVQIGDVDEFGNIVGKLDSCLPLPPGPAAAFHLLITVSTPSPLPTGQVVAAVTLHYVDGGTAVLPIRAGQEVRGYAGNDLGVPLAFSTNMALALMGLEDDVYSAPRLPNPEPRRLVRCIGLQVTDIAGPLLLLGITVEPATQMQAAAPVIPAPVSRIDKHKMQQGIQSALPAANATPIPARNSP